MSNVSHDHDSTFQCPRKWERPFTTLGNHSEIPTLKPASPFASHHYSESLLSDFRYLSVMIINILFASVFVLLDFLLRFFKILVCTFTYRI